VFFVMALTHNILIRLLQIPRIEHLAKVKKAKSKAVKTGKDKAKDAVHRVATLVTPGNDDSPSWKKDIVEGRREKSSDAMAGANEKAVAPDEATWQQSHPNGDKHEIIPEDPLEKSSA
jgi:hypothetical protein